MGEGIRRVGGDVDGLPGAYDRLFAAEGGFNLAVEEGEGLLEIMPVGRRSTAGRDVHVDQAVAPDGGSNQPQRITLLMLLGTVRHLIPTQLPNFRTGVGRRIS
jgi:hypothetical protein